MTTNNLEVNPFVAKHVIHKCETTTVSGALLVRFPPPPKDPTPCQSLRLIEESGTLSFWDSEKEDGYSLDDGEPT